ncbi:MAG: VWA domain-containing protein [Alphaproteobacteria bacterium]
MADKAPKIVESQRADVDEFLEKLAAAPVRRQAEPRGRLIFALDATMSRQPTWDRACHIQANMFSEAASVGALDIKLIYFRGHRECKASKWYSESPPLLNAMTRIYCQGGYTQIERVLKRTLKEARDGPVSALVYVGDACEEEVDRVCGIAGQLGVRGVPAFMFQEGREPYAEGVFREVARLSGGAYCRFDEGSADQLKDLLSAVAVFAAGGRRALVDYGKARGGEVLRLANMMKGGKS